MRRRIKNMYKKSGAGKSTPFKKSTILQKEFDWNVNDEITLLTINSIDESVLKEFDLKNHTLYINAWDSDQDEVFKIKSETLSFPIKIDLSKKFKDFTGLPRFALKIFEDETLRVVSTSKSFIMTSEPNDENKQSLIRMVPANIGSQIARLANTPNESPYLEINREFVTQNGEKIGLSDIKNLIKNNPTFCIGFWPNIIKEIFNLALDEENIEEKWAQKWLNNINNIAPGNLTKDKEGYFKIMSNYNSNEDFIKDVLPLYLNNFIRKMKFDSLLFSKLKDN
tara:strand:+ start:143 stop:985 length:843 start_codon:yes stop_codon:yes gene_type:complete